MAEAETNHYLRHVARVRNQADRGKVTERATRYLRFRERQERQDELQSINERLHPTNFALQAMTTEGKTNLVRRRRNLEDDLKENSPPTDLAGPTRDALLKRERELVEKIRTGMPAVEEMRRNPAGAVDKHRKWMKATKDFQLEWKNLRIINNPDDDSQDLANVEMIRPSIMPETTTTYMADAQIPGLFAMTKQAKENWPLGEPKIDTPLKQAEMNELEELRRIQVERQRESAKANYEKAIRRAAAKLARSQSAKKLWAKRKEAKQPEKVEPEVNEAPVEEQNPQPEEDGRHNE